MKHTPETMKLALRAFLKGVCTHEDFGEGAQLYSRYHRQMRELADAYEVPIAAVCGAFAALSPNSSIDQNLKSLVTVIHAVRESWPEERTPVATYNRMRPAAFALIRGEAEFADVCAGPKISAFRHNILFPETSNRITIDGHMIAIMLGYGALPLRMKEAEYLKRAAGGYEMMERVFRTFANRHCVDAPHSALQAVMWHARRRVINRGTSAWTHRPASEIAPWPMMEAAGA